MYGGPEHEWYNANAQVSITHPTYRKPDLSKPVNPFMARPSSSRLNNTEEPWIGASSLAESPWQQPYLWRETNDADNAQPWVAANPPEGRQSTAQYSGIPGANYYAPDLPVTYGPQNLSNPLDWQQNQQSAFQDARYYPIQQDWEQMTDYEKQTFVEKSQRDQFVSKLYKDVGDLMNERHYQTVQSFNRLEDREAYMQFQFGASWDNPMGNFSLRPNFKDKWSELYTKYHENP